MRIVITKAIEGATENEITGRRSITTAQIDCDEPEFDSALKILDKLEKQAKNKKEN